MVRTPAWEARKKIALFDTLLQQAETREVVAVLAHEIGHDQKASTALQPAPLT